MPAIEFLGELTPTTTSVAASTSSVQLLAANASRKSFSVCNTGLFDLFVSFTNPATSLNSFIRIPPGGYLPPDITVRTSGAIYGIWDGLGGTAQVTEYE